MPLVARFELDYTGEEAQVNEWTNFSKFFKNNKKGILTKEDIKTNTQQKKPAGHAAVLIGYDS